MKAKRFEGLTAEECINQVGDISARAETALIKLRGEVVDAEPGSAEEHQLVRVLATMTGLLNLSRASVAHLRDGNQ